ncbi:unnamed protein product, partial [Polarella glacialis]
MPLFLARWFLSLAQLAIVVTAVFPLQQVQLDSLRNSKQTPAMSDEPLPVVQAPDMILLVLLLFFCIFIVFLTIVDPPRERRLPAEDGNSPIDRAVANVKYAKEPRRQASNSREGSPASGLFDSLSV